MKQQKIEYRDGEQSLQGQLFCHDDQVASPTVILYHAFEGLSAFVVDYAEQLVREGFTVFSADVYGDGQTADTIDGCFDLVKPFLEDRAAVRRRAILAYEAASQQASVDTQRIAVMGFCFGGMCALECARSGADVKAVITAHGVLAQSDLPTEPMSASFLILHGYQDPQVPPECLSAFADEMNAAGVNDWVFTFFGTAKHSFTDPKTGSFDAAKEIEMGREYQKIAAERSFDYAVELLHEKLV